MQLFLFHSFAARPSCHRALREKTRSTTHRCPIRGGEGTRRGTCTGGALVRNQVARVEDTRADRLNAVKKREARVEDRATSISLHKFVSIFFFFFFSFLCTRSFFFFVSRHLEMFPRFKFFLFFSFFVSRVLEMFPRFEFFLYFFFFYLTCLRNFSRFEFFLFFFLFFFLRDLEMFPRFEFFSLFFFSFFFF